MFLRRKQPDSAGVPRAVKRVNWKPLLKEVGIGAGALVIFVILVQLLYPSSRSLPYAYIGKTAVGYRTVSEVQAAVQQSFNSSTVHLSAQRVTTDATLPSLGAALDAEKTAAGLMSYPLWQRVLPFSIFWARPNIEKLYVTFNDETLKDAASSLSAKLVAPSKNGSITVDDNGNINLVSAEEGVSVTDENVKKAIQDAEYSLGVSNVSVTPILTEPAVTNDTVGKVKSKIEDILQTSISIKNSMTNDTYTPSKKDIASWIRIGDDMSLSLDKDAALAYVNELAKAQLVAAGTSTVTMVDGRETGRTAASTGRGVNGDQLTNDLTNALFDDGATAITLNFVTTQPKIVYNRSYTYSQAALQAYIDEVTASGNIEIAVTQLDGAGWTAASGATKSVVSASTYKLFISLLLFEKVNAGQLGWSSSVKNVGTSVDTCLYNTIIYSANTCPEEWISEWGRQWINNSLYAKGFSTATTFMAPDATHTSAGDLRKLLVGLYNSSLFTSSDTTKLIGLMKNQVYRSGIPAGSDGIVADKVGFLWDYLNDAAIVYHPRGTYVLVIMTKGESWAKIAEITKQLENIMYP